MIGVIWSDLRAWGSRHSRSSLPLAVCGLAVPGALTLLEPMVSLSATVIVALWAGLQVGRQIWSGVKSWEWADRTPLSPAGIVAGKMLAALINAAMHLAVLLPGLAWMVHLRGIGWPAVAGTAVLAVAGSGVSAAFGLAGAHLCRGDDEYLAGILALVWLAVTGAVPSCRPWNPLLQIQGLLSPARSVSILPGLAASLSAAAVVSTFAALLLRRGGKERMTSARQFYTLLARGQRGLNRLLRAAGTLQALLWSGVAAGPFVLVLRWSGRPVSGPLCWIALTIAGGALGLVLSRRHCMNQAAAARWLDRRLGADEVLSAALFCLERGGCGPFDGAIVAQAEEFAGSKAVIRWPWRPLLRQAGVTILVLLLSLLAALLPWPRVAGGGRRPALAVRTGERGQPRAARPKTAADLPPSSIARRLFPRDSANALLAEEALRSGNVELLNRLLAQAQRSLERQIAQAASPAQREQLLQEQEGRMQAIQSLENRDGGGERSGAGAGQGEEEEGQGHGREGPAQHGGDAANRRKPGADRGTPRPGASGQGEPWEEEYYTRYRLGQGETGAGRGGSRPGTGRGGVRRDGSALDPLAGPDRLVIAQSPDEEMLELVLPGREARVPLADVVPSSRRAAEEALWREYVPLEYLDSVRWYFLALAGETAEPQGE